MNKTPNEIKDLDMVIEFSKDTLEDIFGATLDKTSCIGRIIGNSLSELWATRASGTLDSRLDVFLPFRFNTRFLNNDLPPPKEFSGGAGLRNSIVFSAKIGLKGQELGRFGIMAQVDTMPAPFKNWTWDLIRLNLESQQKNEFQSYLNIAQVDDLGLNSSFHSLLTKVGSLPLLPIPVKVGSSKPADIVKTFINLTPDTLDNNQEIVTPGTVILSLVFGGNTTNPSAFTQNFLQNQESASIAISFGWIKRLLLAELEGLLPGISQNPPSGLSTGGGFKLTFDATIANNKMIVTAVIKKNGEPISLVPGVSGIPYDATLSMTAEVELSIDNKGEPSAKLKSFTPVVSVNVHDDYVTSALNQVLGAQSALLVGTLFANLKGLLDESLNSAMKKALELAQNTLQNAVTSALDRVGKGIKTAFEAVASKVGDQNGFVTIPIIDTGIHLSRISVDNNNIMVSCKVVPRDNIPLRKEGEITIRPGLFVDLDCASSNRMLSTEESASSSLKWVKNKKTGLGILATVGLAKTAIDDRKGHRQDPPLPLALNTIGITYENILHYKLHAFAYETDKSIKQNDLFPKMQKPGKTTGKTFAFMTAEGRYCLIKANSVNPTNGALKLQYRTYSPYCLIGRLDYLLGLPIMLF
jgi:hypothetical protein